MNLYENAIPDFLSDLSSASPTPGGGGASALTGAIGVSLGSMVGNLTVGKKKYALYEEDIKNILKEAERLREKLLLLVAKDAEVFEPLARAYRLPKDDPETEKAMEAALDMASTVPLYIMKAVCRATELLETLEKEGSVMAISDVGVGAACCRASLQGAALNIYINAKAMKNRSRAEELLSQTDAMLKGYVPRAEAVYASVSERLRQRP